eukprot:5491-Heterococcus_DN1.PRE.5
MKSLRKSAKADRAILAFDLQADLAPAFNWNIKQVILWDKIIERPEDAKLNLKKIHVKYGLIDQVCAAYTHTLMFHSNKKSNRQKQYRIDHFCAMPEFTNES